MRSLKPSIIQNIKDLDAEGCFGRLPLPMIEKDIHLTDVLSKLSKLKVYHPHFKGLKSGEVAYDDGIKLVFCGGTSLSKAHGIIERMSEDVDLKVILTDPDPSEDLGKGQHIQPKMLKKDVGSRARLKALHDHIAQVFHDLDFNTPNPYMERRNPHIRDKHRYLAANVLYDPQLGKDLAIRPTLKIELIHRHPRMGLDNQSFGYLHESIAKLQSSLSPLIQMPCVSLAETVAEKVISLLRRSHWNWLGGQERPLDPTLVRHIYDVHQISLKYPSVANQSKDIFGQLVDGDREEFKDRDMEFYKNPRDALFKALDMAKTHPDMVNNYNERLIPLIYASNIPDFNTAMDSFTKIASVLLDELPHAKKFKIK